MANDLLTTTLVKIDESLDKVKEDVAGLKVKVDVLTDSQTSIKNTLENHVRPILVDHVKRSESNERAVEILREEQRRINQELVPLKDHVVHWSLAGKIMAAGFSVLVGMAGIATAAYEIWYRK